MAEAVGKALLLPEDMKVWQEKRSKHMLENLKRDSILVSFETFYSNVLLYIDTCLNEIFIYIYIYIVHFILFFISSRPFKVYSRPAADCWRPNAVFNNPKKKLSV